jgi:hypothetical protein
VAESPRPKPDLADILKEPAKESPKPPMSMIGAIVLVKNPTGAYSPAIVLDDFGGNLKLAAFYDSGQRMGYADCILIPDASPEPKELSEAESERPWTYWKALPR